MNSILTVNGGSSSLKCALFCIKQSEPDLLYNFKLSNILGQARAKISDHDGNPVADLQPDFSQIERDGRHQACLDFVFAWIRDNAGQQTLKAISPSRCSRW